jgi:hypothetical protein
MLRILSKSAAAFEPSVGKHSHMALHTVMYDEFPANQKTKRRKTQCINKSNELHSCYHFTSLKLKEGMRVEEKFLFSFKTISDFKGSSVRSVLT